MGELWRRVSELIWKRPVLLLPVLVADLLGFFVNLGRISFIQTVVLDRMQYRSALGGAPVRVPLTGAALEHTTVLILVLNWVSYFLRMLLYAAALIATAALVQDFVARRREAGTSFGAALRRDLPGIFSLSLRALAIFAVAGMLLDWSGVSLVRHGHKDWLVHGWPELAMGVLLFAALAFLLAPTALHVLTRRSPAMATRRQTQVLAFLLGVNSLLLGRFVAANIRTVHSAPVARFFLGLTGSWIVALPYALFFVALGLLASDAEKTSV